KGGVKAIWNFAHTDLDLPPDVVVENVHLSESLMQLSYNINRKTENKKSNAARRFRATCFGNIFGSISFGETMQITSYQREKLK
ncbi:hypothetical protein NE634_20870, partial [Lacrimispora saccharolytica]|nr:hypothetical protein [Lacrimispora saccharolytica]